MKKYSNPQAEYLKLSVSDIIASSGYSAEDEGYGESIGDLGNL